MQARPPDSSTARTVAADMKIQRRWRKARKNPMTRRLLITLGFALTFVLLNGGAAGVRDSSRQPPALRSTEAILTADTTSSGPWLLPSETTWSSGAPSF